MDTQSSNARLAGTASRRLGASDGMASVKDTRVLDCEQSSPAVTYGNLKH